MEAHNYWVNAANKIVEIFKNLFVSGLCTFKNKIQLQLWCDLLHQLETILKFLYIKCINSKVSAFAVLEGNFNFNHIPLTYPGTNVFLYIDPTQRKNWEIHAKYVWYFWPAMHHYWYFEFWMTKSHAYLIAKITRIFPT